MKKRYWLRGLVIGIVVYVLVVVYYFVINLPGELEQPWPFFATKIALLFLSPAIPLGLLIGWLYGKIKIKNKIN
jgi:hypothetical protein